MKGPRAAIRVIRRLQRDAETARFLLGQLHAARVAQLENVAQLEYLEFSVYSQWGEDGILEYLLSRIAAPQPVFIEFGVEDYRESNTRFLLKRRNWTGLLIEADQSHVRSIRADPIFESYELHVLNAFVTAENINSLISGSGITGDVGLLSVDIDGNDYWVWRAIEVVSPRVVVCEYNSVFGEVHAITVPYDPAFQRRRAHHSKLFFGASLRALRDLAAEKGYVFVGCNSAGGNAFFVRVDCAAPFEALAKNAKYVASKFRESVDRNAAPTFLSGAARAREIQECTVYDLRQARTVRICELDPPLS